MSPLKNYRFHGVVGDYRSDDRTRVGKRKLTAKSVLVLAKISESLNFSQEVRVNTWSTLEADKTVQRNWVRQIPSTLLA
ncbi:hypothetical protein GCM10027454_03320 [Algoriphagus aestuariicola]